MSTGVADVQTVAGEIHLWKYPLRLLEFQASLLNRQSCPRKIVSYTETPSRYPLIDVRALDYSANSLLLGS